jgi:hypothetical protein
MLLAYVLTANQGLMRGTAQVKASEKAVAILARIVSISPSGRQETVHRKRWIVKLYVLQILHGDPAIEKGDVISIQVHSISREFGADIENVKGKIFRLKFLDAFSKEYDGDVDIESQ